MSILTDCTCAFRLAGKYFFGNIFREREGSGGALSGNMLDHNYQLQSYVMLLYNWSNYSKIYNTHTGNSYYKNYFYHINTQWPIHNMYVVRVRSFILYMNNEYTCYICMLTWQWWDNCITVYIITAWSLNSYTDLHVEQMYVGTYACTFDTAHCYSSLNVYQINTLHIFNYVYLRRGCGALARAYTMKTIITVWLKIIAKQLRRRNKYWNLTQPTYVVHTCI